MDYALGDVTVNGLTAGSSIVQNLSFKIPTTVPVGNYYFLAFVDRLDNIVESNESNNVLASVNQINVTDPSFMDLTATSLSGLATGVKGSTITISSTIKNQGNTNIANNFIVRYYFSVDQVFQSASDYSLGDVTVNGLTAGSSLVQNLQFYYSN